MAETGAQNAPRFPGLTVFQARPVVDLVNQRASSGVDPGKALKREALSTGATNQDWYFTNTERWLAPGLGLD